VKHLRRRLNPRLIFLLVLLLAGGAQQLAKEHRPSLLRPGLRMYAYINNAGDATVTAVDLISLAAVSSIPVGPAPSGIRAHPTRAEIWGVSSEGGYVWVIDARAGQVAARIPVGASPFAVDFSPDGARAYVAASGSGTVSAIDCATRRVVAKAQTGRRPWLARVSPDGALLVVPNRDDSTVALLNPANLSHLATIPVATHPEQVVILPDSSKAFLASSAAAISVLDLRQRVLLATLPLAGPPADLVLKPDDGKLFVPSPASNGLSIVDTWKNEIIQHMLVGDAPVRASLTADLKFLYLTDAAAGRVMPLETRFTQLWPPIAVGQRPGVSRFTPGDDLLLVVNEDSGDLAVIRPRTNSLLTMIPVGRHPRDLAIKVF